MLVVVFVIAAATTSLTLVSLINPSPRLSSILHSIRDIQPRADSTTEFFFESKTNIGLFQLIFISQLNKIKMNRSPFYGRFYWDQVSAILDLESDGDVYQHLV